MRSKGSTNWLLIGLFIVVILFLTGYITLPTMPGAPPAEGRVCPADISPDLMILGHDIENPSSAVTTGSLGYYRKVGVTSWTQFTPGTEITDLEPFETYEIICGAHTTIATGNDYEYGPKFTHTMKCKPDEDIEKAFYIAEEYGGITATYYNADDNAAAETWTAGQVQTISIKMNTAKEQYFGNPYVSDKPNVLAIDLNNTAWEKPTKVSYTTTAGKGGTLSQISCPAVASADSAAANIMYCYEAPVIDEDITRIWIGLEADGSNAPIAGDTTSIVYLYCGSWYFNTDTGDVGFGVENNDAAYVCGDGDADSTAIDC